MQLINPMPSTVKTLSKFLHKILCALLSFSLIFLVTVRPLYALSDGQQLILEAWNIVNEGFLNQEKFDQIQWKRLRKQALEGEISTSNEA